MKRRILAFGLPAVAALALSGCKAEKGNELIGYWISRHKNGQTSAMIKIERKDNTLVLTVAEFTFFSRELQPPSEKLHPLSYSRDLDQHGVQTEIGFEPVIRIGDKLSFNSNQFDLSTAEKYAEWMATVLPVRRF